MTKILILLAISFQISCAGIAANVAANMISDLVNREIEHKSECEKHKK